MSSKPAAVTVSALETHIGYWLRAVSNQVSAGFAAKVASEGVSVAEWVILRQLFDIDTAPSLLAEKIGMTRGAVTKIADRLIAKALVTRIAAQDDRRYQALALTKEGRRLVPKLAALADQNDREFFGHMSAGERKAIEAAMRVIVRRHGIAAIPIE
ncbi:MAG TPA: MarR family transcriptional regulator [Magnetospirillaceae bacterium]